MNRGFVTTLCLCLVAFAGATWAAGEAPADRPKSPQATAALWKRDKAVDEAERAYREALLAAEREAVDDLKAAQATAMKAGNLPEANAIDAEVKAAQARVAELQKPRPKAGDLRDYVGRVRAFRYGRVGVDKDEHPLELLPDGTIGKGNAVLERRWRVERAADGGEELVISGDKGDIAKLRLQPDGTLRGRWLQYDKWATAMTPVAKP